MHTPPLKEQFDVFQNHHLYRSVFHDFSIILDIMFMLPQQIFQGRLTEADLAETTALFGGHSGNQGPVAWRKAVGNAFGHGKWILQKPPKVGISWNIHGILGY